MQNLLTNSGRNDNLVDDELGALQLRERFFSLDHEDFPDLNALDEMGPESKLRRRRSMVGVKASKQDSGVKFRSGASTLDSVRRPLGPGEPIIVDETPLSPAAVFEQYMLGKDRAYLESLRLDMIDDGNFQSEHKTLWQAMPAAFFRMEAKASSSGEGRGG